jgi:hypothetical protein
MADQHQQEEPLSQESHSQLVITYRGNKVVMPLHEGTTVEHVKNAVAEQADASLELQPTDVKLLWKGKVLKEDDEDLFQSLNVTANQKTFRLVATGVSSQQVKASNDEFREGMLHAPRVRDDVTEQGLKETEQRQRMGRFMMQKVNNAHDRSGTSEKYGFGRIQILPNLPNQEQAREILTTLANDPGILACMAKHKWKVGSLSELYPEGKVGESAVCVMGLNKNAGQEILLRIRTDDLSGFRKILNIRKVLYHELAHNVHSAHDGKFFQLNRQVEKECTEMDWTGGAGLTSLTDATNPNTNTLYTAGAYRLGGDESSSNEASSTSTDNRASIRELAARAALMRMTAEEEEIQQNCGCGRSDLFLPQQSGSSSSSHSSNHDPDKKDDDGMDVS